MKKYDLCIIGAGASGLAAAISAKLNHPQFEIALVEKLPRAGKKILATGNGRCNLTNENAAAPDYSSPSFVSACFDRYPPAKVREFFLSLGLVTYADGAGRVYPRSNTAASVLDALRYACGKSGVDIITDTPVSSVKKEDGGFSVNGEYFCSRLIIAAGGKASPSQGSDGSGFALARSLGHTVTPLFPSLTAINTNPSGVKGLKGVRASNALVTLTSENTSVKSGGEVLFTDSGVSGICVMDLSAFAARAVSAHKDCLLSLDLLPETDDQSLCEYIVKTAAIKAGEPAETLLTGILPKQLGVAVLKRAGVNPGGEINPVTDDTAENIALIIKNFTLTVTGTKGFENAQVTSGGVSLSEIDSETLMSKIHKGLYFCGEITDVDSKCGGYNLQWAFASGLLAGELNDKN